MPVTLDPTAPITEPAGGAVPVSRMWATSGSSTTRNPSTLARIQPGPVHDGDLADVISVVEPGDGCDWLGDGSRDLRGAPQPPSWPRPS